jgi:hypothetical protein
MDNVCSFNRRPFTPKTPDLWGRIGARFWRATPWISNLFDWGRGMAWLHHNCQESGSPGNMIVLTLRVGMHPGRLRVT